MTSSTEFVEQMKIKKFAVLGYSFGGPYALACASSFPPSQLLGTAVVSGIAPYNGSNSVWTRIFLNFLTSELIKNKKEIVN